MPLKIFEENRVLYLSLDTPGCAVNIFNNATAAQVSQVFEGIDRTLKAVVVRSAKPGSFINGVGLMLAQTADSEAMYRRASDPARRAYQAIADSPVPTIAAVEGSCLGCGVEFILHCHHRLASDADDTYFYMTELNDYRIIPMFRSTWRMPRLIGLAESVNFLINAPRWSAADARKSGLIDQIIPRHQFGKGIDRFIAGLDTLEDRVQTLGSEETIEAVVAEAQSQIEKRPPTDHWVYQRALSLLSASARGETLERHHPREISLSAKSSSLEDAKAAYSFFYIRQIALQKLGLPNSETDRELKLSLKRNGPLTDSHGSALFQSLESMNLTGVKCLPSGDKDAQEDSDKNADVVIHFPQNPNSSPRLRFPESSLELKIRIPSYLKTIEMIEIEGIAENHGSEQVFRNLISVLRRLGYPMVVSSFAGPPVTDSLFAAYLDPILRFMRRGGTIEDVNGTLRAYGFVHWPCHKVRMDEAGLAALREQVLPLMSDLDAPAEDELLNLRVQRYSAESKPKLFQSIALSLLAQSHRILRSRRLGHVSLIDVLARDFIGFPQGQTSLGKFMSRDRVAQFLDDVQLDQSDLSESVLETCADYVSQSRDLYR